MIVAVNLDAGRLAYYGLSWGGGLGAILPAVEPRIKANVLYVAGLGFRHALPEVDEINYIGHVKQPTLILNGELDFFFPAESSQRPMFELLGTPGPLRASHRDDQGIARLAGSLFGTGRPVVSRRPKKRRPPLTNSRSNPY
jgi:pimeloyl-ACP methyl ester carboxylesterase